MVATDVPAVELDFECMHIAQEDHFVLQVCFRDTKGNFVLRQQRHCFNLPTPQRG
jgi:hypothetical protein